MSKSERAVDTALQPYGIQARNVRPLSGYHDECYLIDSAEGRYVLKIAPVDTPDAVIDFETSVVRYALEKDPRLPIPAYLPTRDGRLFARTTIEGSRRCSRLLVFSPGILYADFRPHTPGLRRTLGATLGRLDAVLADFRHPAMNRYFEWDLATAADAAAFTGRIRDPGRRRRVDQIFATLFDQVNPALEGVRRSVIHADANDYNILVTTDEAGTPRIAAILDFGDTVLTHTVNELAIACAYAMLGEADPVAAAADVIGGYASELSLTEEEVEVLYPLILTRLAMSVTFSARWKSGQRDSASGAYQTVSESAVWDLLDRLEGVSPDFARYAFRDASGMTPCSRAPCLSEYLKSIESPASVLPADLRSSALCTIDLSVRSTDPAARYPQASAARWSKLVLDHMSAADAAVGVGRYGEARACYTSAQFGTPSGQPRTVHLGIDLFAAAGTPVSSPLPATVHSLRDNNLDLDYGPTVVLEHAGPDGLPFYTLFGHLSRSTLRGLQPGQRIEQGERVGELGTSDENGGWPPHLHFQIVTDMLGMEGNFPGVAAADRRDLWESLCPNPNSILRIPDEAVRERRLHTASVLRLRERHTGENLRLSYQSPLHIVRGRGQYLYDVNGLRYLDGVNNVAHVGHGHPRVVDAISRQASVLNTNTRYLHENLVRYAERLAVTLPEPLSICYFVNSGSEANDLALRMARAHTGGSEYVVLGGAYHGHLSSLIDVSPYKFGGPGGSGPPRYVHELPAPDTFRGPYAGSRNPVRKYSDDVGSLFARLRESGRIVAAFIAESALSCAGQIILPAGYLSAVYDRVREAGGVCIADEVQVGFGRTGSHFWVFEAQGVVPDIVTMGKPIGNGHPLGAVVTTNAVADSFANGMEYFNTYGGNPVSCAAGLAVLEVVREEGLQQHARDVGARLMSSLRSLATSHPSIGDVRGSGLFVGIEIVRPGTRGPEPRVAAYIVNRLREMGALLSTDGPDRNVIKIKPPMVFDENDVAFLVDRMSSVLNESFVTRR